MNHEVTAFRQSVSGVPTIEISPAIQTMPRTRDLIGARRQKIRSKQRKREALIHLFLFANGLVSIVLISLIFIFLFKEGVKAFLEIGPIEFVRSQVFDYDGNPKTAYVWQPVGSHPKYSLLPLVCGTFLVAVPATLLATIIGLGCGIYMAELASRRTREIIKPLIELLAGIPTVIIGFLFLTSVGTLFQTLFHTTFRLNAFLGVMGVSLVIIPLTASLTEDALRAVPNNLREASLALGATRWQTISRVVLPAAVSGVSASIILGMSRAIGETMIVLLATGNAAVVTANPFASVRTMTATIASELGAVARHSEQYYALFLVGTILFTITFIMNLFAEFTVSRMRKKLKL